MVRLISLLDVKANLESFKKKKFFLSQKTLKLSTYRHGKAMSDWLIILSYKFKFGFCISKTCSTKFFS